MDPKRRITTRAVLLLPRSLATLVALAGCSADELPDDAGEVDEVELEAALDEQFPVTPAEGLSPTPPMGWNSWNNFGCSVSASLIMRTADAMVRTGMKDAGYEYVNIDDCWLEAERNADGTPQLISNFPDGMKEVADYVHALGLKLGVYSDRGTATCAGRAGALGYERQDAKTYAEWGVDYLKYDNCNADEETIEEQYQLMGEALSDSGRDIVYSICAWKFHEWGVGMGHLWRTTGDIEDTWDSIYGNIWINENRGLAAYAGPNGWNDPDMLEVGRGGMTNEEYKAHFSLWAIASAPLIAGNDLRLIDAETIEILTNEEVIALNQDELGLQGTVVWRDDELSIWAKPLNQAGARGVVLLNAGDEEAELSVEFRDIGLRPGTAEVRDLWQHEDVGEFRDRYAVSVPSHAAATLKITGTEPVLPPRDDEVFLSELSWTYAVNGLGPVEKDQSNGASEAGDGEVISIAERSFERGLGVAAGSMIYYRLGKRCNRFSAVVGLDGIAGGNGSVAFEVWADDEKVFQSEVLRGDSDPESVDADISGAMELRLRVTNGQDGSANDRANWGDAKLDCSE